MDQMIILVKYYGVNCKCFNFEAACQKVETCITSSSSDLFLFFSLFYFNS